MSTEVTIVFQPFAEPVGPEELVVGGTYYLLNYADQAMRVPLIRTLRFTTTTSDGKFEFQDLGDAPGGLTHVFDQGSVKAVFTLKGMMRELARALG